MGRIQRLPPNLINQIAAGEVVERPASVIKELLENAIDAGSTRIEVEVAQGGSDLIQVVDNGCGIQAEDLSLAFASHATSKLSDTEGLFRIETLGFRGEALASIGSIAQVTLQSRPADQPIGAEVTCHGGELSPPKAWNGSPGTRIQVRHLFYNTPARRKFLRSVGTEMGHISECFTSMALARLGLHLTLRHNGRVLYEIPSTMNLLDRVALFFGAEVANSLYQVQADNGSAVLGGYIGDPSCDRGNSQVQYLFLNGRWVRDRGLFQAVQDAYRGLLMTGRYPVAFLFLDVPPDQVDVNVHPAKSEVRFRDKEALYQLVQRTVRNCLQAADLTAHMQLRGKNDRLPAPGVVPQAPHGGPATPGSSGEEKPAPSPEPRKTPATAGAMATEPSPQTPARSLPPPSGGTVKALPKFPPPSPNDLFTAVREREPSRPVQREQAPGAEPTLASGSDCRAMQVLECYLVVEVPPDELLFIDQHALHERILYEQFQHRLRSGTLEVQRLLIPEPINLSVAQAAVVLDQREALAELGLLVEDFGGGTVLLTGYPALLSKRPAREVFQAVIDQLVSKERLPDREQLLNDLLSLMACHAAVRAGDRLTQGEISSLLAQRQLAQDSHHCPHGRPTSLRFSRRDLEKLFKRV